MQKLINDPADAVLESLQGLQLAYPDLLRVHYHPHFVARADAPVAGKVAIISGSGSGHEPLNVGYVGRGMLDAACPGPIFTSPTPDQYLAATRAVYGGAGALYIVKNYTGGVLNTSMALDLAREEGFEVASVLVNDDVAVEQSANRRGMGAAVVVEKIAGAAAEAGRSLTEVEAVARRVIEGTRSMGVALSSCTSPSLGRPTFHLPDHQIEVGVGIHGEPGRRRLPLSRADAIVDLLVEPILKDLALCAGDQVLAMVSGLGATPQQELYIAFRHVHEVLSQNGIRVERRLVGNFLTSLDMAGCIVTLARLDPELIALWDAPVRTPALVW
ncbi:MAG TPA: dihydroxyacetone kinase subunit DhaK [Caldilineaceae bacterium]|nr:dihydroxyacetone kinase subunit DhaK [Caldilineaceae bacterium]